MKMLSKVALLLRKKSKKNQLANLLIGLAGGVPKGVAGLALKNSTVKKKEIAKQREDGAIF